MITNKSVPRLHIAGLSEVEMKKTISGEEVTTKGRCTAWEITLGCNVFVNDGNVGVICVD